LTGDPFVASPLGRLEAVCGSLESVVVAFSGGVDSALLVAVSHAVLGDRVLALTADSATFPPEEAAIARDIARSLGVRHRVVASHELEVEGYASNTGDRCYFCKRELFQLAERVRTELGAAWVADGTVMDDLSGHRPGLRAAREATVRHPLVEAGLTKADVRNVARSLGLPVWDKPSFACLGSRFPVGTRVTEPRLRRVQVAESALRRMGFRQFRVRYHVLDDGDLARIELGADELGRLADHDNRAVIVAVCRGAGFARVTLDLAGYGAPLAPPSAELP